MAHRSRVCAVGFDTSAQHYESTVAFWSAALGRPPARGDGPYTELPGGDTDYFIQRIGEGPPRVHVDIETDDVEAEVARLEGLGARRLRRIETWWIMEDPGGHVFCVVPVQSRAWPRDALEWG